MKKHILILFIFLVAITSSFAQQPNAGKRVKEIEAIKIGYITRRLSLTPEESQKFWPVYNSYQKELLNINKQKKENRVAQSDNPEKLVDDDFKFDTQILELKKRYRLEFAKVLSAEKVKNLYIAEREFREELIKQLKNRKEGN
jgi:Skp family chaperone for outer membrane proteins